MQHNGPKKDAAKEQSQSRVARFAQGTYQYAQQAYEGGKTGAVRFYKNHETAVNTTVTAASFLATGLAFQRPDTALDAAGAVVAATAEAYAVNKLSSLGVFAPVAKKAVSAWNSVSDFATGLVKGKGQKRKAAEVDAPKAPEVPAAPKAPEAKAPVAPTPMEVTTPAPAPVLLSKPAAATVAKAPEVPAAAAKPTAKQLPASEKQLEKTESDLEDGEIRDRSKRAKANPLKKSA